MEKNPNISPSELKTILHSKRSHIYILKKCRILQKDGRVVYLTSSEHHQDYYNIPIANTSVILLSMGTSITQEAVRMLSSAGVIIGFCGTNGTPLLAGTVAEPVWMFPQSEYRPTKYMQGWAHFWFDADKQLEAAKIFQRERVAFLKNVWNADSELLANGFQPESSDISEACRLFQASIDSVATTEDLLLAEAVFTKRLYKAAAKRTEIGEFIRDSHGRDPVNIFLTHGNYLAYGLGAICCWVLGLSHSFPVMHGKTRRGGLVFDIADLIKDILVLPFAFLEAAEGASQKQFRDVITQKFLDYKALDHLFKVVESVALKWPFEDNKGVDDHAGNLYVNELKEGERSDSEDS